MPPLSMPEPTDQTPAKRRAHDPLAKFPGEIRDAYARFKNSGDVSALDTVVLAVVRDFIPRHVAPPANQPLPDNAKLMADLGFDSLAIAETVFFLEDLFNVKISNEEIMQVSTVAELRAFIRGKLAENPAR
jgi:acyl carrier protein